ncbi:MAG TPA: TIGR00730 family Rossman fold protein, partial [Phycisphaerales bacterium]|nr:TIGR00730 family Rossman fold protein [Phycisphaerales bacterium]
MKSVTVYCSSSSSLDPHFTHTAEIVGREIAKGGRALVYGGGSTGLMGDVARACAA